MKNRNESRGLPPVGLTSLLVILSVLALTVFALLALSSVRANSRLRQQTEQAVLDYYAADCAAEEILARLRNGEVPRGVRRETDRWVYECTVSSTQILQVEAETDGLDYHVFRWQAVSSSRWETEDDLPVWSGEEGAVP